MGCYDGALLYHPVIVSIDFLERERERGGQGDLYLRGGERIEQNDKKNRGVEKRGEEERSKDKERREKRTEKRRRRGEYPNT